MTRYEPSPWIKLPWMPPARSPHQPLGFQRVQVMVGYRPSLGVDRMPWVIFFGYNSSTKLERT